MYVLCVARYSLSVSFPLRAVHTVRKLSSITLKEHGLKLPEGLLVLCKTCHSMKLHIHPHNTYDADSLKELLERKFLADKVCEDCMLLGEPHNDFKVQFFETFS